MKSNFLNILLLAFFTAFSINMLNAQDSKAKTKVVVVEKTVDKDGNVDVKKVIKEGKEAEEYLKDVEVEVEVEADEINNQVFVTKTENKNKVKIITTDESGKENVFIWEGEGDIPADVKEKMDQEGFDVHVIKGNTDDKRIIVKVIGDGEEEEIIVNGLPDNIDFEKEFDITVDEIESVEVFKDKIERKAQLGVMISNAENGVEIIDVMPNSAAAKHGLKVGDVILSINDIATEDVEGLVKIVAGSNPDENIEIKYERDGEPVVSSIKLQKPETWPEAEDKHEEYEEMIIIRKKKE